MKYEYLDLERLVPDDHNLRPMNGIESLAESIAEHGLLQNLVVEYQPATGKYIVRGGNRRYHAIKQLAAQGRWKNEVLCLINDGGPWSQIVENVCQQVVPVWRLGARYAELAEAGHTLDNIAGHIGKGRAAVSYAINIAQGLHPKTIVHLEKMPPETLTVTQLLKLSRILIVKTGDPDHDAQMKALENMLNHTKPRGRNPGNLSERSTVWIRYKKLRDGQVPLPPGGDLYVDPLVEYLGGRSNRLRFEK
jgi:ParB/Sulfiredoxin domain